MRKDEILKKAVKTFGHTLQIYVATEEMGELIQALSKDLRGKGNHLNILEEVVDVQLMLDQLKIIYGFEPITIESMTNRKLEKLAYRLCEKK